MPSASVPIIECRNVQKHYGALAAVGGIDLTIRSGETVGIGGPNGAGKTTFFDLLSGITRPSAGDVIYDGRTIDGVPPFRLFHRGLARTFQVTSGFGDLTVFQNMLTAILYGSGKSGTGLLIGKSQRAAAFDALEEYGLADLADHLVSDIPALARKKLMVATAVVHRPRILLLDEPVGGLTSAEIDSFIELMDGLRRTGIGIVFIEHVMRFLTSVADRALIMHQGRMIYDGEPAGIARDPLVKSVYLGSASDDLEAI